MPPTATSAGTRASSATIARRTPSAPSRSSRAATSTDVLLSSSLSSVRTGTLVTPDAPDPVQDHHHHADHALDLDPDRHESSDLDPAPNLDPVADQPKNHEADLDHDPVTDDVDPALDPDLRCNYKSAGFSSNFRLIYKRLIFAFTQITHKQTLEVDCPYDDSRFFASPFFSIKNLNLMLVLDTARKLTLQRGFYILLKL